MKKIKFFVMGTIVLTLSILSITQYFYHHMSYAIKDEIGDASIWKQVTLETGVMKYDIALFDITVSEGKLQYELGRNTNVEERTVQLDTYVITERIASKDRFLESYDGNGNLYYNEKREEWFHNQCQTNVYLQDKGSVSIELLPLPYGAKSELTTELMVYGDEQTALRYHKMECAEGVDQEEDFDEVDVRIDYQMLKENEGYYLMLNIDPHMEGTADIYQIQLEEDKDAGKTISYTVSQSFPIQRGTAGFLAGYQEERYVFLWYQDVLTIEIFDEVMQNKEIIEIAMPMQPEEALTFYQNEQYLLVQHKQDVFCFDMKERRLIDTLKLSEDIRIEDMLYRNGMFYLVALQDASLIEDEEQYKRGGDLIVQAYQQQELLYQGRLTLFDRKCRSLTSDMQCEDTYELSLYAEKPARFVRDAS